MKEELSYRVFLLLKDNYILALNYNKEARET
jgi:hypothetical protein